MAIPAILICVQCCAPNLAAMDSLGARGRERDLALERLRNWTAGLVVAACVAVGVLSGIAANTFPGHNAKSTGSSSSTPPSTSQNAGGPQGGSVVAPPQASSGGGGGTPVVTGGS